METNKEKNKISNKMYVHILVSIVLCCTSFTSFSQDVITTKLGETIQAKIIEVTDEYVSFKKYLDQQGETFIIKIEHIKIIAWENGDVNEYEEAISEQMLNISQGKNVFTYIDKKKNLFYFDDGQVYDEKQLKQYLIEKNLNSIWTKYSSGKKLSTVGWGLIGTGFAFTGAYIITLTTWGNTAAIISFGTIAAVALYTGIPIAIVGTVRKNRAIFDYNATYARKPYPQYSQDITIKTGCVGNGIGFVLNF